MTQDESAELVAIRNRLEDADKQSDSTQLLEILNSLSDRTITMALLKETQIGVAVGKLRKNKNESIASLSSSLVERWRTAVGVPKRTPSTGPSTSVFSPGPSTPGPGTPPVADKAVKAEPAASAEESNANGKKRKTEGKPSLSGTSMTNREDDGKPAKQIKREDSASSSPKAAASSSSGESLRERTVELLREALGPKQEETDLEPSYLAKEIEARIIEAPLRHAILIVVEMYDIFGGVNDKYKAKYRSLAFNLKNEKNPQLRASVLSGAVEPKVLCTMTSADMASPEMKEKIEKIRQWHKEASMINRPADQHTTDQFQCGKCKERKTTYYQMQTRSADEPMTTFVTCLNCNNRWKFC